MLSTDNMDQGIRSAEKDRVSSCPLADNVAQACIDKYKEVSGANSTESNQSVLAGIVATIDDSALHVLCIATGNKFTNRPKSDKDDADVIRDCHAEVLVRRAFKFWLLEEWKRLKSGDKQEELYFTLSRDSRLVRRLGVRFFLYVSSAPCGNACIRRWGQSQKEIFEDSLGPLEMPLKPHEIFHAHAKKEGQTAISYKGDSDILSCSDKVLKWNVLGIQGTKLRSLVDYPIFFDGIVVGRKFVPVHSRRAFCCRLSTKNVSKSVREKVNHPVLMCSAVKYDTGVFRASEGEGATFDTQSMWWSGTFQEELDGCTGQRVGGEPSLLCHRAFCDIRSRHGIRGPPLEAIELRDTVKQELKHL